MSIFLSCFLLIRHKFTNWTQLFCLFLLKYSFFKAFSNIFLHIIQLNILLFFIVLFDFYLNSFKQKSAQERAKKFQLTNKVVLKT